MGFLRARNMLMTELNCSRRVATLATRLERGVDTWEGIDACRTPCGRPLLSQSEVLAINVAFGMTVTETWCDDD